MLRTVELIIVVQIIIQSVECLKRIDPLVETKVGLIRGLQADDGDYSMFLGIPYAQVDVQNPFGKSKPQPKFEETFEAYDDSAVCPQVSQLNNTIIGTVNCLQLNIYVPNSAASNKKLPVMVWIYGGSFMAGVSQKSFYGPSYLVKHDVILVVPNYRVGAYGFMCLDIPEVPGNQGLKDQFLALQWVKDNIEAFGGDSGKVTLIGQSAGGHSVDLHLISDKEPLYHKVIMQSGSSLAATILRYEPDKLAAIKIAKHLGFKTNDTKNAFSIIANVDPNLVISAIVDMNIVFKPCVETQFNGVESFFSESWIGAKVPKVKNMPVLIGFNQEERAGTHFYGNTQHFQNLNLVDSYLESIFDFKEKEFEQMKNVVQHFYFGEAVLSEDLKFDVINFDSDSIYVHPVQRTINKYLEAGAGNIYYYMFSYVGGRNRVKEIDDATNHTYACCTSHADDLGYLFNMAHEPELTEKDKLTVERMTTMWTNFAKFSDPTPETTELLPVKWIPLTKEAYAYMNIGADLSLGSRPAHNRMAFWHLFYKLNEKSQRGL